MDIKTTEVFDIKYISDLLVTAESAPPGDKQCDAFIELLTHLAKIEILEYPQFVNVLRRKCKTIELTVSDLISTGTIDFNKGAQLVQISSVLLEQTKDFSSFDYN